MYLQISRLLHEVKSMLYWTMLAACTVGPGTVVTCARAGAEYDLSLIWALVFASILAYTLQEGTARLTIVSGKSLGQCLRVKYKNGAKIYDTAVICWLVSLSVFFGNTLYECNNWAGGIDAILAIPGTENTVGLRVGCCLGYAVIVLALLYWDKVDMLGVFLGVVMMCMVVLFLIVVLNMDINGANLGWGFLPNIPERLPNTAEPTDIVLSLVGTTSIGFNLFLGGSMAEGKALKGAQRGIGFSTVSAFLVSVLILIVGSGKYNENGPEETFQISSISEAISNFFGTAGVVVFALGFIAAALSSMLTVPLGAALTANSLFTEEADSSEQVKGVDNPTYQKEDGTSVKMEDLSKTKTTSTEEKSTGKSLPRWIYLGIMFVMVIIATTVISANVDRTVVILIAQVFNGLLLPFFSICLLLCINDEQFMSGGPQKGWANLALTLSVIITLFLASNVIVQKAFGSLITIVYVKILIAAGVALVIITALLVLTSLGRDLLRSFQNNCCTGTVED